MDIYIPLCQRNQQQLLALIIRGARQVGKSWAVEHFGHQYFDSIVVADFEKRPELKHCFHNLDPKCVLERLVFYLKKHEISSIEY